MRLQRNSDKWTPFILTGLLTLITLLCMTPLVHTIAVSFSGSSAATAGSVTFWPKQFTTYSYRMLLEDNRFFRAFSISVERVVLGGALQFILTVLMAYPLSKETSAFRSRNIYMWIIVATMLFNGGLISWYMVIKTAGMLDSIWALVVPSAVPVFNVILLLNFFRSLPRELEEAAKVDGTGAWRTLFRIYLPVSLPALATVTLFSIVGHWNAFFDGLVLINTPEQQPLQTYIQQLVVEMANLNTLSVEEIRRLSEVSNKTLNAAKIMVSMIPVLIVYPLLQKYFISGIVMGSVKE